MQPGGEARKRPSLVASRDLHSPLQFAADTALFLLLSVAAGIAYTEFYLHVHGSLRDFVYTGLTVALLFAGIERLLASRRPMALMTSFDRLRDATQNWSLAFAGLLFSLFALKAGEVVSRGVVLSLYVFGLPIVGVWRVLTPPVLAWVVHKAGYSTRECIVIGGAGDPATEVFAAELMASGYPPPTIVRFHAGCTANQWTQELHELVSSTIAVAHTLRQGEIFLCASNVTRERLTGIERALSVLPRAIYLVPDADTAGIIRCKTSPIGTHIAVELQREPLDRVQRAVKRAIDIVLASIAVVCLAPLMAVLAVVIKLDSKGPVLFTQTRLGYRGKPFRIFKFRSMYVQEDGPVVQQASRGDARVTRIGRFLRKSSLDELPQLINILLGQMSLVGPRPHAQAHDELYSRAIKNYEVRQHVKPGLTGWAQVHGLRGETKDMGQMYRRIEFDLWYAVNVSLLLDCEILVRTVLEVFRHRNAY